MSDLGFKTPGADLASLGLCGYSGGRLLNLAQNTFLVPAEDMQLSEDFHFIFGHMVMKNLCNSFL
jgi:D-sedoheptulose 7-phosphate isomerase